MAKTENIVLIGGGLAVAALFGYHLYSQGKKFVNDLGFKITGFSVPTLNSGLATVPLTIEINNPSDFGVDINDLAVDINIKEADESFSPVARVTKPGLIQLSPNEKISVDLAPEINLNNINIFKGQSFSDVFNDLLNQDKPLATFRIDYSFKAQGVPQQGSEIRKVNLPKII